MASLPIAAPCGLGMIYAALPGSRADGRAYIADAVARGASAVLAPLGTEWPAGVTPRPLILDAEPRRALARLAALHAGPQPDRVVAITGTNGKTSTAEFLRQMFASAGIEAASLGTLGLTTSRGRGEPGLTTPDPVALAETLASLARDGVQAVGIEASSHGLDQFRLDGVQLIAAGFSNLTRDHLDYHGSAAAYRTAKLRLFDTVLPPGAPAVASTELDTEDDGRAGRHRHPPWRDAASGRRAWHPVAPGARRSAAGRTVAYDRDCRRGPAYAFAAVAGPLSGR